MNRLSRMTAVLGAGVALAIGLAATPGWAQQNRNCAPRDVVVSRLAEGYGETRQSIGLGANNAVIETYASDETGSWTITVTMPGGLTCLVASGQAFERLTEALPTAGNDT